MTYRLLEHRDRRFRLLSEYQAAPPEQAPPKRSFLRTVGRIASAGTPSATQDFASDLLRGGKPKSVIGQTLGWDEETSGVDRFQDTLSLIGIVDPFGVADATNAIGYAMRGKWGDMAISIAGLVPYLGDVAKIGKFMGKGAKVAGKGEQLLAKGAAAAAERGAARTATRAAAKGAGKGVGKGAAEAAAKTGEKSLGRQAYDAAAKSRFVRKGKAQLGRKLGRYGRSAVKAVSGEGKLRGKAAKIKQAYDKAQEFRQTELGQRVERGIKDQFSKDGQEQPEAKQSPGGHGPSSVGQTPEAKRPTVPVGEPCPPDATSSSRFGAPPGQKRCYPQQPGSHHD